MLSPTSVYYQVLHNTSKGRNGGESQDATLQGPSNDSSEESSGDESAPSSDLFASTDLPPAEVAALSIKRPRPVTVTVVASSTSNSDLVGLPPGGEYLTQEPRTDSVSNPATISSSDPSKNDKRRTPQRENSEDGVQADNRNSEKLEKEKRKSKGSSSSGHHKLKRKPTAERPSDALRKQLGVEKPVEALPLTPSSEESSLKDSSSRVTSSESSPSDTPHSIEAPKLNPGQIDTPPPARRDSAPAQVLSRNRVGDGEQPSDSVERVGRSNTRDKMLARQDRTVNFSQRNVSGGKVESSPEISDKEKDKDKEKEKEKEKEPEAKEEEERKKVGFFWMKKDKEQKDKEKHERDQREKEKHDREEKKRKEKEEKDRREKEEKEKREREEREREEKKRKEKEDKKKKDEKKGKVRILHWPP